MTRKQHPNKVAHFYQPIVLGWFVFFLVAQGDDRERMFLIFLGAVFGVFSHWFITYVVTINIE